MESVLMVIHVIIALVIVALIMLQQGKGAEMGASFGAGSSQTVFGAAGSGNFFSRLTAILVFAFFCTSIFLAVISQDRADSFEPDLPVLEEADTIPAEPVEPADALPQAQPAAPAEEEIPAAQQEVPAMQDVPAAQEPAGEDQPQPVQ